MNLFRRLGAVLPGAKDQGATEAEDDPGGFGPPGGVLWTTPVDVLSDRPKAAPDLPPTRPAEDRPAPATPLAATPLAAAPTAPAPAPQPVPAPLAWDEPFALPSARPTDSFTDISATADISGFVASCLVDSESGLMLASEGGEGIDLEAAAALNTQVVRAEHEVIAALDLDDHVEDILITMTRQLHFIRPLEASPSVFLYVCLDKKAANLGMARMQVNKIESGLKI